MITSCRKPFDRVRLGAKKIVNWIRSTRLIVCSGFALIGAGCGGVADTITGSGALVSKEYPLSEFSRVAASNAFQVEITRTPQHSVIVTVDDNLVDYLDVTQSGETLRIGLEPNVNVRKATLNAEITMPALSGVDISGAVRTTIAGFSSGGPFDAELSGATNLRGDIQNGDARFVISGASKLELQGSAAKLEVSASGASEAQLGEYLSSDAVIEVSGASNAIVHTTGALEAEATGASSVRYVGQPGEVKRRISGASSVEPE
ncbi:MAG TPA: head GIN domain-containing protein [Verrucomicrobiales bacterium]|nr:head GIN domain-containing protein [Verrucomicrobiales bacterium]